MLAALETDFFNSETVPEIVQMVCQGHACVCVCVRAHTHTRSPTNMSLNKAVE